MPAPLLEVRGLKTYFTLWGGVVKALDGIDLTLGVGEIMGIVGESGGGKSVTAFSIMRLIDPPGRIEAGKILFEGEDLLSKSEAEMRKMRGRAISMVFQDPMTALNPLHTIKDQIDEALRLHTGMNERERGERILSLLHEVGIPNPEERLSSYPHQFSGGMLQRVVIAIALAAGPRLIIADEPTTALDVTVQAQILSLMEATVRERGAALILITHDLAVAAGMADKIAVMYCGRVVEAGTADSVIRSPAHPYTRGLLNSMPSAAQTKGRLAQIPGVVPSLLDLPPGCAFAPRCELACDACGAGVPAMVQVEPGHEAACFALNGGGNI
ncbi:MAG: ABC transporter ATP-binding protein [Synergistaceae bacterium]|jgi:oligopeptide/dipeptide ABC transporter ATP-binding protein|nr:ABC transporter ATP-binding protein [Synergistaceae bacterium]